MTPIRFARVAGGWLTTCPHCATETFHTRRPQADRWTHQHRCKEQR